MKPLLNNQSDQESSPSLWPKEINQEIKFPYKDFESLIRELGFTFPEWLNYWQRNGGEKIAYSYWSPGTGIDWIWGLGFPFLTEIKRFISSENEMTLLGISALPGCGKSSLGRWLEESAKELNWSINVLSLDDFYLPGKKLDNAMLGNPWNVPRALPGSHSIELLQETIENWFETGILKAPQFDKALRNGLGDRSGWISSRPKILVIEGWFLGCTPENITSNNNKYIDQLTPPLSDSEFYYRERVQQSLEDYIPIWDKFKRLWHIKPDNFSLTSKWKIDQENEMYLKRGSSLKGSSLDSFVRMIHASIPQQSLMNIKSNVVIRINQSRQILWAGNKKEEHY